MNILVPLRMAWSTIDRSVRWFLLAVAGVLILAAALLHIFIGNPSSIDPGTLFLVVGAAAFWWMFTVTRLYLVYEDLHVLRAPHPLRSTLAGLIVNIVLSVLLPTAILTRFGAHFAATLALFCAALGLTVLGGVVPRTIVFFLGFIPTVLMGVGVGLHWPGPTDPNFATLGFELAAIAWLTATWQAIRLHRNGITNNHGRLGAPMVLLMHKQQGLNGHCLSDTISSTSAQATHATSRFTPDVVQESTRSPTTRIRWFLGPPFLPVSIRSLLKRTAPWLLIVTVLEVLGSVFAPTRVLDVINLMVILWIVLLASIFAPLMTAPRLSRLFEPAKSSGVAELALLPGFGAAAETRRALLHAAVYPLLRILAVAICVIAVLWSLLDGAWSALPIFALVAGNATLFSAGMSIHAMAGHGLDSMSWGKRILYSCMAILSLLLVAITSLATPWLRYDPPPLEQMRLFTNQDWILPAIALAWTVLLIGLYVNFRNGWHAFQHRPHPFLLH